MAITVEQALQQGIAAHQSGKLQKAEKFYKAILNTQPQHPIANHNLGVLAVGIGKVEDALPYFKVALAANNKMEQFWLSYIDALIKLAKPDDARRAINQCIGNDIKSERINHLKAQLDKDPISIPPPSTDGQPSREQLKSLDSLYRQGKLEEALAQGNDLANHFPLNPIISVILGMIYTGLGRSEEAIANYNKAIEIKPDYVQAFNNLAGTFNKFDQHEKAILNYNKAIELKPDYSEAHYNLGNVLNAVGRYEEAIASYNKAIELKPGYSEAHNNLGNALNAITKHEEAITSYNKAIEIKPDYAIAHNNLGNVFKDLDRHKEAIASYNKALRITPRFVEANYNLGTVLYVCGRFQEAVAHFSKAIELQPDLLIAWSNISQPLLILKIFHNSSYVYESAIPKSTGSLVHNRELAILKYKLNRGNPAEGFFFDELKEIMRKTPYRTIKKPDQTHINNESLVTTSPKKIFALTHFGRSGTGLLHSLIDNHSEVTTLPSYYLSEFFNHVTWDKITNGGWSELTDQFIAMYPVLFDARAPDPVLSLGGKNIYEMGIEEGMTNVGEDRDEYLSVDEELFRISLNRQLSFLNNIDAYAFFKLVHIAYEEAQMNSDNKNCIFYHIHNPSIYAKLNFIDLAPDTKWVVMVREPLQSCESWIRPCFNNNDYEELSSRISKMLFDVDDFIFQRQNNIGIRLEDIKREPKKTMNALCTWMGVKEEPSLYEMTAQGKKWWGEESSPEFGKNGQAAFDLSSINRKVGSIFSDNDQFILATLFYPFRVRFNYVEEDLLKFKSDLKKIRPMIDQMFDFEKKIAERQNMDPKDFIKLGFYLNLRANMVARWEALNKHGTYPNMLNPMKI